MRTSQSLLTPDEVIAGLKAARWLNENLPATLFR